MLKHINKFLNWNNVERFYTLTDSGAKTCYLIIKHSSRWRWPCGRGFRSIGLSVTNRLEQYAINNNHQLYFHSGDDCIPAALSYICLKRSPIHLLHKSGSQWRTTSRNWLQKKTSQMMTIHVHTQESSGLAVLVVNIY